MTKPANLNPYEVKELLHQSGTGFRAQDDEFFKAGNRRILDHQLRLGVVSVRRDDPDNNCDDSGGKKSLNYCSAFNCHHSFRTVAEAETHYKSVHRFTCAQCKRNLPSAHLLDLHLEEKHDSYFEMLSKRKASFRCVLEECPERFWSTTERREHGITTHKIPSNFRFTAKEKEIKKLSKKQEDEEMEEVMKSPEDQQKHLNRITFGHKAHKAFDTGYAKALTKNEKKDKKKSKPLEDNKMVVDLLESLPQ